MKIEKINKILYKPRILIAPLDWGLGHVTRCIPIIHELLIHQYEVIIAASGASAILLKKEFPALQLIVIKGYDIRYSRRKFWLPLVLLWQFPKLLFRVMKEQSWLKKWLENNNIHLIISDNRLGLHHPTIPSIYITHQLKIKTGNTWAEWILQKIHYHFINKYQQCWVPDMAGDNNLAGELSHPKKLPKIPVNYIGLLSRFGKKEAMPGYDLLFIISGPEPQRTIFEALIFEVLKNYQGTALVIRGLPGTPAIKNIQNPQVQVLNHLSTVELNDAINQSNLIISRSGYTTVMDLVKLQKKAVLVPTPGQTEQEYLATYLLSKKYFYSVEQKHFCLEKIIEETKKNIFSIPIFSTNDYKKFIEDLFPLIKQ
jgi:uncharacterized protein (TIGR00661 family)